MLCFYVTTIMCAFFDTVNVLEHLYEKINRRCVPAYRECNQGITQIFAINKDKKTHAVTTIEFLPALDLSLL